MAGPVDMTVSNPEAFCAQFRDELIADLQLRASICCPKCVITYIGGAHAGDQCYYDYPDDFSQPDSDDEYESTGETDMELHCFFDYENTDMKDVIRWWKAAVLKACEKVGGVALKEKWVAKFAAV